MVWIDGKSAWRGENIRAADFFGCDARAIDDQFIFEVSFQLTAGLEIIVHRQDHDSRVARAVPLGPSPIPDQPVGHRFDQLVSGIDGQKSAQGKGGGLDAAIRPAPINAILAPMRGAHGSCWLRVGS